MKKNILIYGIGSFSKKFVERYLDYDKVRILAFIETHKSEQNYNGIPIIEVGGGINEYNYDAIIIISGYLDEMKENLIKNKINLNKCIFTSDIHNWCCINRETINLLLEICVDQYIQKDIKILIENEKQSTYEVIETNDGFTFIGNYADDICGEMIDTGKVYSYKEIEAFFELSDIFYPNQEGDFFFDCGCNILSTSIYALKKRENLRGIAFEPSRRTYILAKTNAALNNLDERISVYNLGLSDYKGIASMKCNKFSCGGNYVVRDNENYSNLENINMISLDLWVEEQKFNINRIGYLWIDVEGFEGYVIKGMMNILTQRKIPMYLEYYSDLLIRSGCYDYLNTCLEKIYSGFIVVSREGKYNLSSVKSIEELKTIVNMRENIFLIP